MNQLLTVRNLLDQNRIPCCVDETAIYINGRPEVTVINLGPKVDVRSVKALLDGAGKSNCAGRWVRYWRPTGGGMGRILAAVPSTTKQC
jgi:hypothetical protein